MLGPQATRQGSSLPVTVDHVSKYVKLKAVNDPKNLVHVRLKGTLMDKTECGLNTLGEFAEGEVTCHICKRLADAQDQH